MTLTDASPPAITATVGDLFAGSSAWRAGSLVGSVSATDAGGGVGRIEVLVDGVPVPAGTVDMSCDFTYPRPCPASGDRFVSLATELLADGAHTVRARVTDATRDRAGANQTLTDAVTLRIDNHAPAAPTIGPITTVVPGSPFAASWAAPAVDAGSPIAGSRWELVDPAGGVHASGSTSETSLGALTVPFDGVWALRVRLTDAAGEGAAAVRTFSAVTPTAPSVPATPAPPEPTGATPTPLPPTTPDVTSQPTTSAVVATRLTRLRATRHGGAVTIRGTPLASGRVRVSWNGRSLATVRVYARRAFAIRLRVPRRARAVVVRHHRLAGLPGRAVLLRLR